MTYILLLLIPIGIYFIFIAIKTGASLFKQPVIFDTKNGDTSFTVTKDGMFEIWVKAESFKINNLDVVRPLITEVKTGNEIHLFPSLLRTRSNNFSEGRMHLFSFNAKSGEYSFQTIEESSLSSIEKTVSSFMFQNSKRVAVNFYIKTKPPLWTFPLFLFSIFASIGSILCGIILPFAL